MINLKGSQLQGPCTEARYLILGLPQDITCGGTEHLIASQGPAGLAAGKKSRQDNCSAFSELTGAFQH